MIVLNRYSTTKYLIILATLLLAMLYALPNIYGQDPVVQITEDNFTINAALIEDLKKALADNKVKYKAIDEIESKEEEEAKRVIVRFYNTEDQLKAIDILRATVKSEEAVVLNLVSAAPAWLSFLGGKPVNLGLDLRGGVHFLLDVDIKAAIKQTEERYVNDIRGYLRKEKLAYRMITHTAQGIIVRFQAAEDLSAAQPKLKNEYRDFNWQINEEDKLVLTAKLTDLAIENERKSALEQNIITLRNRVNELGVAEPLVQQQGENRIVVQLPGVQDPARAKEILGATATLEFRLAYGSLTDWDKAEKTGAAPVGARLYKQDDDSPILLERKVIITGEQIIDASSGIEQESGSPAVFINLDGKGARYMGKTTKENIGNLMAVVFIENKVDTIWVEKNGELVKQKRKYKIERVINVATIRGHFTNRFQITGLDSTTEARDLALLLRAGALRAPIEIVEERTIGPSLGQENINRGMIALVAGFIMIMIFMAIYYKLFGLIANAALIFNLVLLSAVLSLLQATLTLPGIAGIVLTLGMAVDANVLIFERIKEELRNGNSPQASIHAGYERAFATIIDANITTLIAAVVLFSFGAGPIKGFAITLFIGILTSMFTAILGSRALVNFFFGSRRQVKTLSI